MGIYTELEEKAIKRFKEAEDAYREWLHKPVHIGDGILEQIGESGELSSSDFFLQNFFVVRVEKGEGATIIPGYMVLDWKYPAPFNLRFALCVGK